MQTVRPSSVFGSIVVWSSLVCAFGCGTTGNGAVTGGSTGSPPGAGGQSTAAGAPQSGGTSSSSVGGSATSATGGVLTGGSNSGGFSSGGAAAGASSSGGASRGGASSGGASSGGVSNAGAPSNGGSASGGSASGGSASGGSASGGSASAGAAGAGAAGGGSTGPTRSAGCGKTTTLMNGRASIDVAGTMREYILALPTGYDSSRAYRLVFGWHPLGGSAQQVASGNYYGLKNQAGDQLILVAPEGLPYSGSNLGWGNNNGRDLAFLQAMLDRFRSELCVDEARIFSTGFSFGGMMSFAAGCSSMGMMRAIAPMAGNSMVSGCQNGDRSVAVMGFHGDHDGVVSVTGGRTARDIFVKRNGCSSETEPATPNWCDGLGQNYKPCTCVSYKGCKAGYPVVWCEYNADHMPAPSSAATLWNFFSQF